MTSDTRQRLSQALELIGRHYDVAPPPVERPIETIAFLAEALAGLLIEIPPTRMQGRVRREKAG